MYESTNNNQDPQPVYESTYNSHDPQPGCEFTNKLLWDLYKLTSRLNTTSLYWNRTEVPAGLKV